MYAWYHCIMFCLTTLRFAWQPNWFNYEGITLEAVRPIFDPNLLLYFYTYKYGSSLETSCWPNHTHTAFMHAAGMGYVKYNHHWLGCQVTDTAHLKSITPTWQPQYGISKYTAQHTTTYEGVHMQVFLSYCYVKMPVTVWKSHAYFQSHDIDGI